MAASKRTAWIRGFGWSCAVLTASSSFAQEPIAPTGPLTAAAPLPDPLAPAKPTIVPNTTIQPVSASTSLVAPGRSLTTAAPNFRDKQIQVAAFIGTDVVITDDEVWQMVRQRAPEYLELFGSDKEKKEKAVYREELRKLIERELIVLELYTRMRKNKADDKIDGLNEHARDVATRRLTDYRNARGIANEAEFTQILQSQGLTMKGIRRQLERDALVSVYLEQTVVKDKEKFVTLNDLWDYYLANQKEFAISEKVKWLDLFVSFQRFNSPKEAKEYADAIWRNANTGVDFVQLTKKYGHGDSGLRDATGIGTKRGEIQPSELETPIFEMKAGQVSPLLQTATGYHIIKVTEMQKAGTRPFDGKVQAEIRAKLTKQLQEREYKKLMDDLWRRHRPQVIGS
jgi:peptidyl-prolyl cis-trans isomerase SurA